ncbi:hypothetical protein C7M84_005969 [Penaeus vannamei]|uniref:Uncharacterized protein n=1 Tax=Penaeus vannamei TaxID=6689 RepID=A0A423UAR7_PENVA|nr:hypothetical protein C7M84_005969 [Penaeus vannamei]
MKRETCACRKPSKLRERVGTKEVLDKGSEEGVFLLLNSALCSSDRLAHEISSATTRSKAVPRPRKSQAVPRAKQDSPRAAQRRCHRSQGASASLRREPLLSAPRPLRLRPDHRRAGEIHDGCVHGGGASRPAHNLPLPSLAPIASFAHHTPTPIHIQDHHHTSPRTPTPTRPTTRTRTARSTSRCRSPRAPTSPCPWPRRGRPCRSRSPHTPRRTPQPTLRRPTSRSRMCRPPPRRPRPTRAWGRRPNPRAGAATRPATCEHSQGANPSISARRRRRRPPRASGSRSSPLPHFLLASSSIPLSLIFTSYSHSPHPPSPLLRFLLASFSPPFLLLIPSSPPSHPFSHPLHLLLASFLIPSHLLFTLSSPPPHPAFAVSMTHTLMHAQRD